MTRVKQAEPSFRSSKLFAPMSQRWSVRLQGIPTVSAASIAIVELAPPQWA